MAGRDEIGVLIRTGSVTVQVATEAMNGGLMPTAGGTWATVSTALTASSVFYVGTDGYLMVTPDSGASFDVI
jgi:hypothetical protein